MMGAMHPDAPLPEDAAELTRLLESVDPAESPQLVERIVAALEAALGAGPADTDR